MSQTIGLVPSFWKNVERDLSSDGIGQIEVRKCALQVSDKVFSNVVGQVELLKLQALLVAAVPAYGRDVDHSITVLQESAPLPWDVQLGHVQKDSIDKFLVGFLAYLLYERSARQLLILAESSRPILGKAKVKKLGGYSAKSVNYTKAERTVGTKLL